MKQELKGCPFCGGATRVQSNRDWHRLSGDHDDDCVWGRYDAVMMVPAQPDQLAAMVHAWNRRAPDARDARIAELEAELAAEPRATDAPTAVAAADPQLLKFYGAHSDEELIKAQAAHIERLQAKLPPAPSFAPQRVREG